MSTREAGVNRCDAFVTIHDEGVPTAIDLMHPARDPLHAGNARETELWVAGANRDLGTLGWRAPFVTECSRTGVDARRDPLPRELLRGDERSHTRPRRSLEDL